EVALISRRQRGDDALLGVFSFKLLVFVLARANDALNARVLGDKERADFTRGQQSQKAREVDYHHEEGHHPDEAEVEVTLEYFLYIVDLFVSHKKLIPPRTDRSDSVPSRYRTPGISTSMTQEGHEDHQELAIIGYVELVPDAPDLRFDS